MTHDTIPVLTFAVAMVIAYTNGANSNSKGVATLYGSGAASYRTAIAFGTAATLIGGICSAFVATGLVRAFSGAGVVPGTIAGSPDFLFAVAVGAAGAVLVATIAGMPVSTTHGLVGGVVGAGAIAAGPALDLGAASRQFFLPLLIGPALAAPLAASVYLVFVTTRHLWQPRHLQARVGVRSSSEIRSSAAHTLGSRRGGAGRAIGSLHVNGTLLHFLSAGAVSFARGLNDTPKMVSLIAAADVIGSNTNTLYIAIAIAAGGLLSGRRVAETLAIRLAPLQPPQALSANVVTAAVGIGASHFGLPVSITHVSVGSILGVGAAHRTANRRVFGMILASWVLTLPAAAIISAITYALERAQ